MRPRRGQVVLLGSPDPSRYNTRMIFALFAVLLGLFQVEAGGPVADIGPEADWCANINALPPGTEAVLRPATYQGPCTLHRSGAPETPLAIRAKDLADRPHIEYLGQGANVLNVRADHVLIRGLEFSPTQRNVDAIRIYARRDVTVEDCRFRSVGGIAVVANHSSAERIVVRRNEIVESRATAMYFGCHDGIRCVLSDLVLERNFIRGVEAPEDEVGYGLQVKLNSTATIRDNVIADTKGPGIMVYGASDAAKVSVVERNFVAGSRTSSAIVIGGGPAIVRNNVATTSAEAGFGLEDYGRRGLLRGIVVAHNTVYGNLRGGIIVPAHGLLDVKIVNNAAQARGGTRPFPTERAGVLELGNVDCSMLPCFMDPDQQNFSPLAIRRGSLAALPWIPSDDYFGRRREVPPTAGAIEMPARAISLGIKPSQP
jgi:hypothetical protein